MKSDFLMGDEVGKLGLGRKNQGRGLFYGEAWSAAKA
jgi:hypothetical protein